MSGYNDENMSIYNDENTTLNWAAISTLKPSDRIDARDIRALVPNLLWSKITPHEIRTKSNMSLSKLFRALQLCGEIFHSVARNAGDELISRDKSLKEMSSLLRTSERQLRKYRNKVKGLQEEKTTFHEIIRQYRSLTTSSSSGNLPKMSLLCQKCLGRVDGNPVEKNVVKSNETFKSGDDVREFLRNAVERLRTHFAHRHENDIRRLQEESREMLESTKREAKVEFTEQLRRVCLHGLDTSLKRRMMYTTWCTWRHNHEIMLRDELFSRFSDIKDECKVQREKYEAEREKYEAEREKHRARENEVKRGLKTTRVEIERIHKDYHSKIEKLEDMIKQKHLEKDEIQARLDRFHKEMETERVEIREEKKKWQMGVKKLNAESHEIHNRLERLELELRDSKRECSNIREEKMTIQEENKTIQEDKRRIQEEKDRWQKKAKILQDTVERQARVLRERAKRDMSQRRSSKIYDDDDDDPKMISSSSSSVPKQVDDVISFHPPTSPHPRSTKKTLTKSNGSKIISSSKPKQDRDVITFDPPNSSPPFHRSTTDENTWIKSSIDNNDSKPISLSRKEEEEEEEENASSRTGPATEKIQVRPTKPQSSTKPKHLLQQHKRTRSKTPLSLLVLDRMLRDPLDEVKNGLNVPRLFREEPEASLKVDAMRLFKKVCSRDREIKFNSLSSKLERNEMIEQSCVSLRSLSKNRVLLASLMKMYLTEMPRHVLSTLTWSVLSSFRVETTIAVPRVVREKISKLDEKNSSILSWFLPFLDDVATHSEGMTLESLAICFAPSMFKPMEVNMENPLKSIRDQKRYMKASAHMLCLLTRHDKLSRMSSSSSRPAPPPMSSRDVVTKNSRWKCVYRGVRCRSSPEESTKSILGTPYVVRENDVVVALEHRVRSGWIRIVIQDREVWVPLRHEKYGTLFQKLVIKSPSAPNLPPRTSYKIETSLQSNAISRKKPSLPPRTSLSSPTPPKKDEHDERLRFKKMKIETKPNLPPRTSLSSPTSPKKDDYDERLRFKKVKIETKPNLPPRTSPSSPTPPKKDEHDERLRFEKLKIGCTVMVLQKDKAWTRADVLRVDHENKTCDLVVRDSKNQLKDVQTNRMRPLPRFSKGTRVDFWNGTKWVSDVKIVGIVNDQYDVAWRAPRERMHKKWVRRHRHDRVEREFCRPKSPSRSASVRDALAVMDDVHMKSHDNNSTTTSKPKIKSSLSFKRLGRAMMNSLTAVRLLGGGKSKRKSKEKTPPFSSSQNNNSTSLDEVEKKTEKTVKDADKRQNDGDNVERERSQILEIVDKERYSVQQTEIKEEKETEIKKEDETEIKEKDDMEYQTGDRVFCLKKNSTSVWFPGRVLGLRRKKNQDHNVYVVKSDESDAERLVTSTSLVAVEEEEFQFSDQQRSLQVGTCVFALDVDAEGNFHWLLATVSSFKNGSVLVVYDGENEPQASELVWCLKHQLGHHQSDDENNDDGSIFDDTASSVDEEEEVYLQERFNTAGMKLHKHEGDLVVKDFQSDG